MIIGNVTFNLNCNLNSSIFVTMNQIDMIPRINLYQFEGYNVCLSHVSGLQKHKAKTQNTSTKQNIVRTFQML